MTRLLNPSGQTVEGVATSVSADGSGDAGQIDSPLAFIWTQKTGVVTPSALQGHLIRSISGMSADGSILEGQIVDSKCSATWKDVRRMPATRIGRS